VHWLPAKPTYLQPDNTGSVYNVEARLTDSPKTGSDPMGGSGRKERPIPRLLGRHQSSFLARD